MSLTWRSLSALAALALGGLASEPAEAGWRHGDGYGYRGPVVVKHIYHRPVVRRVVHREVYRPVVRRVVYREVHRPVIYRYRRPVVERVVYRDVYRPQRRYRDSYQRVGYGYRGGWDRGYSGHRGWRSHW
jgi:hypothetical protein